MANANSIAQLAIQMRNGTTKHVNVNAKIIVHANKVIMRILSNSKYLKSIADTLVIIWWNYICYEYCVNKNNNTAANNVSINSDFKQGRYQGDWFILHTVLLVIILLLIITSIWYHYAKHRSKQKSTNNIKWKIMNLKRLISKIVCVVTLMT